MSANFTIEIKAPELTDVLKQLIGVITPKAIKVETPKTDPQTMRSAVQAQKPVVVPAQITQQGNTVPTVQQGQTMPTAVLQQPAYPVPAQAPVAATAPIAPVASAPTYNTDDLARAASQLMDAGKQKQLIDLLGTFGVQALTQLPKDKYGEFATALRQLGAKI
jgi:hypothetical protein